MGRLLDAFLRFDGTCTPLGDGIVSFVVERSWSIKMTREPCLTTADLECLPELTGLARTGHVANTCGL
jgi:hypothetical protein